MFVAAAAFFAYLLLYAEGDLLPHVAQVQKIRDGEAAYPPNFLYYLALDLLSGFSGDLAALRAAAVFLLAGAVAWRYALTKSLLRWLLARGGATPGARTIASLSLMLGISFTIPDPYLVFGLGRMYLGRFVPVVWHNSTTIVLFPFAILLFRRQLELFAGGHDLTPRRFAALSGLILVNALIKPSFLFVFLPVSTLLLIVFARDRGVAKTLLNLAAYTVGAAAVAAQYVLIYRLGVGSFNDGEDGLTIGGFFEVFIAWTAAWYVPVSLLISFCIPLLALALEPGRLLRSLPVLYAGLLTACGVLISGVFIESGLRRHHGNLVWQTIPASALLLIVLTAHFAPRALGRCVPPGIRVLKWLFVAQFLSGVAYIGYMIVARTFR
ncbi:hypothetical protein [Phycisphaera mikurensis]|uniref:hypothetical protein n=1 Tax=Phycisphaera mikurensis TaxID=547188 RepID=UPI0012B5FF6B|nr:hypothetical protein [Phycisphaera mikurensis]MBB6442879.1 hypothetical protein [Phycisphaera mikurensis]